MESFFEWFARSGAGGRPWLVVGKGPTSAKLATSDVSGFRILSLNHAVRERPVDAAHAIDLDVVSDCAEAIGANAGVLVMPWHPHVAHRPSPRSLEDFAGEHPVLARLRAAGRLVWYDLSTSPDRHGPGPVVRTRTFSAVAAVNLLAAAGVRTVRTLGVDGGTSYGASFRDLAGRTLLANTQPSFDVQFAEIAESVHVHDLDFAPLDVESPVRVYVGCSEREILAVRALEHSLRRRTSLTVRVEAVETDDDAQPARRRRLVPEIAGRRGRAIYLDAEQVAFRDLRPLWTARMGPGDDAAALGVAAAGGRLPSNLLVLDCARVTWASEDEVVRAIPPEWDSPDRYDELATALLRFADPATRPWTRAVHPLAYLWVRELLGAVERGRVARDLVAEHVARGWVRPSLLHQVDRRIDDPLLLPRAVRDLDRGYAPPGAPAVAAVGALRLAMRRARARVRSACEGTVVHRAKRAIARRLR